MAIVQTVLNYNHAQISNLANSSDIALRRDPVLLAEFGLIEPTGTRHVELLATVGWHSRNRKSRQPLLALAIFRDGVLVASAEQEAIEDRRSEDEPLQMVTTFQAVLDHAGDDGHHVYQLFAENVSRRDGRIRITGPVTISGKAIGTP